MLSIDQMTENSTINLSNYFITVHEDKTLICNFGKIKQKSFSSLIVIVIVQNFILLQIHTLFTFRKGSVQ